MWRLRDQLQYLLKRKTTSHRTLFQKDFLLLDITKLYANLIHFDGILWGGSSLIFGEIQDMALRDCEWISEHGN